MRNLLAIGGVMIVLGAAQLGCRRADPDRTKPQDTRAAGAPSVAAADRPAVAARPAEADGSSILIRTDAPAELLLTDPQGRRTGFNPATLQRYAEIPAGNYAPAGSSADRALPTEVSVIRPARGKYLLVVTGTQRSTYQISLRGFDPTLKQSGRIFTNLTIQAGEKQPFPFIYDGRIRFETDMAQYMFGTDIGERE